MLRLSALALCFCLATAALTAQKQPATNLTSNDVGAGGFSFGAPQVYLSQGSHAKSLALVDVNGDSILDAIVLNGCVVNGSCAGATISVRLGHADGSFAEATLFEVGAYTAYGVTVADINGDTHPDILVSDSCVTTSCSNPGTLSILYGNGDGSFQPPVLIGPGGDQPFALTVADVNGDSKPALIVINYCPGSCGAIVGNAVGELTVTVGNGCTGEACSSSAIPVA